MDIYSKHLLKEKGLWILKKLDPVPLPDEHEEIRIDKFLAFWKPYLEEKVFENLVTRVDGSGLPKAIFVNPDVIKLPKGNAILHGVPVKHHELFKGSKTIFYLSWLDVDILNSNLDSYIVYPHQKSLFSNLNTEYKKLSDE